MINEDKYIIITGGAGFIGSVLLKQLNNQGLENIIVVDALGQDERWKNLLGKRFVEFIHKDQLFDWLVGRQEEIAAFFHLGACSSTTEKNGDFLLSNNTDYSIRLAEYAINAGIRFIYASSAATYGDGFLGFSDDHKRLDLLRPLNLYGFSKHLFDLWLVRQRLLDRVVGLKYFNVYGPNEYHKGNMASAIIKMTEDMRTKGTISLFTSSDPHTYADGDQVRDFIYVKDAAKMTAQFLTNEEVGLFNIGGGEPITWNRLAKSVCKALRKSENICYIPMPDILKGKYQNYTLADLSKSKKAGLALPSYDLEGAVEEYITQYLVEGAYV